MKLHNPSHAALEQWAVQNAKLFRSCATGKQRLIDAVRAQQHPESLAP